MHRAVRPRIAAAALLAAVAMAVAVPEAAARWRAPVPGPIVARFAVGPDPYAAGQRRGIDLAARAGAGVVAPCAGTVSFAGRLPRRGGGAAIRCGRLTATVLGLDPARLAVRAGARVTAGDRLGVVGARGLVRLGARRTASRFGYVDPERLLGASAAGRPPVAPLGRPAGRGPAGPARPVPSPTGVPARARSPRPWHLARPPAWSPAASPAATGAPLVAWAGLALVAAALPAGTLVARRRRRRVARAAPELRLAPTEP